jgi:hypothetical protein
MYSNITSNTNTKKDCASHSNQEDRDSSMTSQQNIDWINKGIPIVSKRLAELERLGMGKPTVREIYYYLVSTGFISNTKSLYTTFDRATVNARKIGSLPKNCFVDNSRRIIDINDEYFPPEERANYHVRKLKKLHSEYSQHIPYWHEQHHYVEVWVEKDAMAGTLNSILKGRQVRIVPNRGWSSKTFLNDNIERVKDKQEEDKIVHVLYLGDLDPSGDRMYYNLLKDLNELGLDFDLQQIAVTDQQVEEYGLEDLQNPDAMTKEKLQERESNSEWFKSRHGGKLFQIELEAMSIQIERFRDLIVSNVDRYFDERIYKIVLKDPKHSQRRIRRIVDKKVKFLELEESE